MSYPPSDYRMPTAATPPGPIGTGESAGARQARERTARAQALTAAVTLAASEAHVIVTAGQLWHLVGEFETYLLTGQQPS